MFGKIIETIEDKTPNNLIMAMLATIKDYELQKFISFILDSDEEILSTFEKSASSSGKYHPDVSNGKWGLLNHTALALLAFDTFEGFYRPQGKIDDKGCDICRTAIILHDAWKYQNLKGEVHPKHTTKEHGFVGATKIAEYYEEYEAKSENLKSYVDAIVDSVRYHMSNWCHTYSEIEYARKKTRLYERTVMICDFIASNKQLINFVKFQ